MCFVRSNGMWLRLQTRVDEGHAENAEGPRDREFFLGSSRGRKRELYKRRAWVKIGFLPTPTVSRFPQLS